MMAKRRKVVRVTNAGIAFLMAVKKWRKLPKKHFMVDARKLAPFLSHYVVPMNGVRGLQDNSGCVCLCCGRKHKDSTRLKHKSDCQWPEWKKAYDLLKAKLNLRMES